MAWRMNPFNKAAFSRTTRGITRYKFPYSGAIQRLDVTLILSLQWIIYEFQNKYAYVHND